MTEEKVGPPTAAGMQAERMQRQAARVVEQLRALADRVEREVKQEVARVDAVNADRSSFGWMASRVVHEIQWGVADLPLGQLITDATAADVYRATGE